MHEMIGEERDALAKGVWGRDAGARLDGWDALDSGVSACDWGCPCERRTAG
jgi:hypothetical protein